MVSQEREGYADEKDRCTSRTRNCARCLGMPKVNAVVFGLLFVDPRSMMLLLTVNEAR